MKRASKVYTGVDIPLFPTMLVQGPIIQDEGSTVPVESHHTPTSAPSTLKLHFSPTLRILIRQKLSGNIDKTPSMPHDSPLPRVNTLRSDDGRMQHNELMDLVTKLSDIVAALETDLEQTKKVYGAAYTKLIQMGRNEHEMEVDTAKPVYIASVAVTTVSITVSIASPTRVSTTDDITMVETLVYIRKSATKDKEAAMRLQDKIDEEERQRIARVHETASSFNIEEWKNIQDRVEADEELAVRLQADERENYTKAEKARMLADF
nr:hypothetical protein [Tanacetum cinerariifolium]